jgi:DNA polymerase-1
MLVQERIDALESAVALIEQSGDGHFGFDTETTGFDPRQDRMTRISLAFKDEAWSFPLTGETGIPQHEVVARLRRLFALKALTCVGWNLQFDLQFIMVADPDVQLNCRMADGMLGMQLLHEREQRPALKDTVKRVYGVELPDFEEATGLFGNFEEYSADDARWSLRIWVDHIVPLLEKEGLLHLALALEGEVIKPVAEMRLHGIYVDVSHVRKMRVDFEAQVAAITAKAHQSVGREFDLNSPAQVSDLLYNELGIDSVGIKVGKDGRPSTAEEWLETVKDQHPVVGNVLAFRSSSKVLTTYIHPWLTGAIREDGRIHASFHQCGTVTGRMSCSDPNLQNIPKKPWTGLRRALCPPPGKLFIQADWSQVELRLMAYFSGDPTMLQCYVGDNPVDIHKMTLEKTQCGDRRIAKVLNFGLLYGMGPEKLAKELGCTVPEAKKYYEAFFRTYAYIDLFRNEILERMREDGYVATLTGRRRHFHKQEIKNLRRMDDAHREGCNMVIQGSAGDILKISLRNFHREIVARRAHDPLWREVVVVSLIHDEMIVEAPVEIAQEVYACLRHHMETAVDLWVMDGVKLPLDADTCIVRNWGEASADPEVRAKLYLKEGMTAEQAAFYFPGMTPEQVVELAKKAKEN